MIGFRIGEFGHELGRQDVADPDAGFGGRRRGPNQKMSRAGYYAAGTHAS